MLGGAAVGPGGCRCRCQRERRTLHDRAQGVCLLVQLLSPVTLHVALQRARPPWSCRSTWPQNRSPSTRCRPCPPYSRSRVCGEWLSSRVGVGWKRLLEVGRLCSERVGWMEEGQAAPSHVSYEI